MELSKVAEPPKIRVVVRKRPLTSKEGTQQDIVNIYAENALTVNEYKLKVDLTKYIEEHNFCFDNAFDYEADNHVIYEKCVLPLVAETFKGNKTTCFAYGQTGSGKTFTMMGTSDGRVPGLYLLASYDVIDLLNQYTDLELHLSFYEIYCGKLYDLLNNRASVFCREDGKQQVNIINLTEERVNSVEDIMAALQTGMTLRASGSTGANAESSRSHAILTLGLKHNGKLYSKMSFIDLAGNERGADTMNTDKQTQMDGAEINKSLLALKECIRALDLGKKHQPFRGSKLTQVLKDSFIGNSKTTMIANISPASNNCEHTLNTLRYADRVKELKKGGDKGMSKDDIKNKEMMLARQSKNTRQIAIDQRTGQILEQRSNLPSKPTKRSGSTMIGAHRPAIKHQKSDVAAIHDPPMFGQADKSRSEVQGLNSFSNNNNNINYRSVSSKNKGLSPRNASSGTQALFQRKKSYGNDDGVREVDDELEDDMKFNDATHNVNNGGVAETPQIKVQTFKMDDADQMSRVQRSMTVNKQSGIGAGLASAIGSGIGGGLKKPTALKGGPTPAKQISNTSSSYAASNGINGHGISGTKIQNRFNGQDGGQPSLMGKFGKNVGDNTDVKKQQASVTASKVGPMGRNSAQTTQNNRNVAPASSFGGKKVKSTSQYGSRPQTAIVQQKLSPRNNLQQQRENKLLQASNAKQSSECKDVIELHELGKDVLSYDMLKRKYGEDTDDLCTDHEKLIEQILEEEDKLINCHRSHIDDVVSVVKDEMTLLNEVDKPGSDVEHYVKKLDEVLLSKIKLITKLRSNVLSFYSHLKTEEQMSKLYQDNQEIAIQSMQLEPEKNQDGDDAEELFYNQDSGQLEKRATLVETPAEAEETEASSVAATPQTNDNQDDLLNKALDRLNEGLTDDLLADDLDTPDMSDSLKHLH